MMEYFTPSIEDIRVGYECEIGTVISGTGGQLGNWKPYKIEVWKDDYGAECIEVDTSFLRVPYLTKEQIEAEGWEETNSHGVFRKGDYMLGFLRNEDKSMITIRYRSWYPEETKFAGECKDINTFRYICKLLGI